MNGSARSQIYWLVGTSATLGAGSAFTGAILADTSITMGAGSTILYGRAIALEGAVTLDGNTVSDDGGAQDFESRGFSGGQDLGVGNGPPNDPPPGVPEPSTWAMLLVGFGLAGGALRRRLAAPSPSGA
jgi:type VI secretion system secreted protein VgrG